MEKNLTIFKSLFKGRADVFAIRFERDGKAGYMPARNINWNEFAAHQAKGGIMKNFDNKPYALLTDERLMNHLSGKEIIGIYPLLKDHTSWFIAADFDQSALKGKTWVDECRQFIAACEQYQLPVYLERSRSGEGGHVWMFFDEPYTAFKSRRIFAHMLNASGIIPGKGSNFDRLFPNQDAHSGMELGNLIALPFQKKALDAGNSCFVDPGTLEPFADQWQFLESIKKVSNVKLDELCNEIGISNPPVVAPRYYPGNKLYIILNNKITIPRSGADMKLYEFLRDNLNIKNTDFFIKKNTGRSTYDTEAVFKTLEEKDHELVLPRGFMGKLLEYCKTQHIEYDFKDERIKLEAVKFASSIILHPHQQPALDSTDTRNFGVIVAAPGMGKTVIGLAIIARKQQPALIIVHRKQLFDQWMESIQSFLNIPKHRIGKIANGSHELGEEITVAIIQSLRSEGLPDTIHKRFGTIIVDECHHMPADTFSEVISLFHTYFLYGLTATPFRKNKDEALIFIHLGAIIHEVIMPPSGAHFKQLSINIRNTDFFVPFNSSTDNADTLLHILIHDTARNELIMNDIKREVAAGRKVLVLTERKAHVEILNQYLKGHCETIVLTGDDKEQSRVMKLKQVAAGDFQALITTGQFMGEGTDIGALDCLVLAYPFSFEGKLVQYIGRVQRSEGTPVIYDYADHKIEYLNNLFRKRNQHYRKLLKAGQLKKFDELSLVFNSATFTLNGSTELSIDCLDLPLPVLTFHPGVIWKLRVTGYNEDSGELFAEIVDYNVNEDRVQFIQTSFYFAGIETIKFRSLDTGHFLASVVLKKTDIVSTIPVVEIIDDEDEPEEEPGEEFEVEPEEVPEVVPEMEHVILKSMKIPMGKVRFMYGCVSFPVYIEELQADLLFEIANADIRPEFEAIKEYFIKVLRRKLIKVDIAVRYIGSQVLSATATSDDIDSINNHVIESVRFEFVKTEILKPHAGQATVNTIDNLLGPHNKGNILYSSGQQVLDDILHIKKSKHYLHLKHLSSRHEASVLKLRFLLQPFSFLFLLSGETKYHIVWETLDSEEATYIWHIQKNREALRTAVAEIEIILNEIKQTGRQNFLEKGSDNFSRIVHDYSDTNKGFIVWKGVLEERLV